jgi:hypothetical protein
MSEQSQGREKSSKSITRYGFLLNELYQNGYEINNLLLGKILTIVDASFSDVEQRKAVKDLVKEVIYGEGYRLMQKRYIQMVTGFLLAHSKDVFTKTELQEYSPQDFQQTVGEGLPQRLEETEYYKNKFETKF